MEYSGKNIGKITSVYGKTGIMESKDGDKLNFLVKSQKLKPVVGDNVIWIKQQDNTIVVTKILESTNKRTNDLIGNIKQNYEK